jgi:hypothetical protein
MLSVPFFFPFSFFLSFSFIFLFHFFDLVRRYAADNISVMSIAFLLPKADEAVIWRGPKKNGLIKQFLKDVSWGALDYLVSHVSSSSIIKNSSNVFSVYVALAVFIGSFIAFLFPGISLGTLFALRTLSPPLLFPFFVCSLYLLRQPLLVFKLFPFFLGPACLLANSLFFSHFFVVDPTLPGGGHAARHVRRAPVACAVSQGQH